MIFHLTSETAWQQALDKGVYTAPSLLTEGFIHCSTVEQLLESAQKHWSGSDRVVVLHIHEKHVRDILKYEPSRNNQLFPHLYGKLPVESVSSTSLLEKNAQGEFEWLR